MTDENLSSSLAEQGYYSERKKLTGLSITDQLNCHINYALRNGFLNHPKHLENILKKHFGKSTIEELSLVETEKLIEHLNRLEYRMIEDSHLLWVAQDKVKKELAKEKKTKKITPSIRIKMTSILMGEVKPKKVKEVVDWSKIKIVNIK